jgi:hypothetical protein
MLCGDFNIPAGEPPAELKTALTNIPVSQYFDDSHFNLNFDSLVSNRIRVTIWETDGRVVYDNYNGKNPTEIGTYYYQNYNSYNNHMARLETMKAVQLSVGCVRRSSHTILGKSFYHIAQFYYLNDHVRCIRISHEL